MLHVTNGDAAAAPIRALALGGDVLAWRDVLHAGPVPAPATLDTLRPIRARFLAQDPSQAVAIARDLEARDRRLGASVRDDEVALWFEHDLYDQLQLVQVLDWLRTHRGGQRVTLAQSDGYLSHMDAAALRTLWEQRRDVTDAQLEAASIAWAAFSDTDARAIERVVGHVAPLPFLGAALVRHLEEFPASDTGLSRSERQILEALMEEPLSMRDLFRAAHLEREDPFYLGDVSFFAIVRALAAGERPFVRIDGDRAHVSEEGRDALAGRCDRVEALGIDRWLGGVHLKGRRVPFRWDRHARRIVESLSGGRS